MTGTTPRESAKVWTVLSLLEWTTEHLSQRGHDEARLHVELMLARALGLRRLDLYLQFDRPLTSAELGAFKALYNRRLLHEPLQYILGDTEFMRLNLLVRPTALIPRPETEVLVEEAIKVAQERTDEGASDGNRMRIIDIGTGTGNIALSIAREFPEADVTATDLDASALELARENATRNQISNVRFLMDDIRSSVLAAESFDLIISNPPYIPLADFEKLDTEVRDFEPRLALTDEKDGLSMYSALAKFAHKTLREHGSILVEVGFGQSGDVAGIFQTAGLTVVPTVKDLAGIERVIGGSR